MKISVRQMYKDCDILGNIQIKVQLDMEHREYVGAFHHHQPPWICGRSQDSSDQAMFFPIFYCSGLKLTEVLQDSIVKHNCSPHTLCLHVKSVRIAKAYPVLVCRWHTNMFTYAVPKCCSCCQSWSCQQIVHVGLKLQV